MASHDPASGSGASRSHAPSPSSTRAPCGPPDGEAPSERLAGFGTVSRRAGLPAGLHVVERAPADGWDGYDGAVVVLVHGSLDRASSFARTARRLPDLPVVAYDRRGYQGSRGAGIAEGLATHVDDLLGVMTAYHDGSGVTVVGHSVGGTVALAAAVRTPAPFASVCAYEPSMPWLGFRGARPGEGVDIGSDPDQEVERFHRRMVGEGGWERLSEQARAARRADGRALVADLSSIRRGVPFDLTALRVPALFGVGGRASTEYHRKSVAWLAEHVPGARRAEIPRAGHGAHLSHPDAFASLVRQAVDLGRLHRSTARR